ncbi:MAG: Butyrate kinase 2 [bacterium ADurb.Bin363]|nr:MAG: Butyrate kinase 2 [bacterium ADurb.Bin363]
MQFNILVINPGSTSTKLSLFKNEEELFSENVVHPREELKVFSSMFDQYEYRFKSIMDFINKKGIVIETLHAVVARGGLMKPIPAGTYEINEDMITDLKDKSVEMWSLEHASNLAAPIANKIALKLNIPSFIVDPITVDELTPVAKISGVPEIEHKSTFHALNLRAVGKIVAREALKSSFHKVNLIGVHMGGGISIVAFEKGKAVDLNRAGLGYGPFSPQRAGTLAIVDVMNLCFSGKYTKKELIKKFMKESGLTGYLGTDDGIEIEKRIETGDDKARLVYEAMPYQTAKKIASMAAVLKGKVDAIFLTGGLANSKMIVGLIKERVNFISKIFVYPSQNEMYALAMGALRVLRGEEKALKY